MAGSSRVATEAVDGVGVGDGVVVVVVVVVDDFDVDDFDFGFPRMVLPRLSKAPLIFLPMLLNQSPIADGSRASNS